MANDVLSGSSSHFQPDRFDNLTRQVLSFQQNARILEEKIEQVLVKQRGKPVALHLPGSWNLNKIRNVEMSEMLLNNLDMTWREPMKHSLQAELSPNVARGHIETKTAKFKVSTKSHTLKTALGQDWKVSNRSSSGYKLVRWMFSTKGVDNASSLQLLELSLEPWDSDSPKLSIWWSSNVDLWKSWWSWSPPLLGTKDFMGLQYTLRATYKKMQPTETRPAQELKVKRGLRQSERTFH